mgnify:CR=1 FL=1
MGTVRNARVNQGGPKCAGIVGLGGAGFPTHVKLTPKDENAIDYVIVNGAECEPYLTSDYRTMMERPEQIIGGLKVMLQLFDNAKGVIAVSYTHLTLPTNSRV